MRRGEPWSQRGVREREKKKREIEGSTQGNPHGKYFPKAVGLKNEKG